MSRSRSNPVPASEIDTNNEDPAYWEMILRREGLGMNRGLHPHVYVGTARDVQELKESTDSQITNSKGHHADVAEPQDETD